MRNYFRNLLLIFIALAFFCCGSSKLIEQVDSEVVIYGGTSSAITSAVQLARLNKKVIIVCPDKHLGGLSSNGLGFTDTGNKAVIGGITREFYQRVYNHYEQAESWKWQTKNEYGNKGQGTPAIDRDKKTMWIFEPHVAEQIFNDLIRENKIKVYSNKWLDREKGVEMKDGKIISITMLDGQVFKGKIFIDATYEGDLMAASGVSYHVGREANHVYNEEWNGVQVGVLHHTHHFGDMKISPYVVPGDSSSNVLHGVSKDFPGIKGDGDNRLQAYCFRLCLTKVKENQIPITKPENYNPHTYDLLAKVLEKGWKETFKKFDMIPNSKTDANNHGPFSFDYIGMNYDYPEASYNRRTEIIKAHEYYQKGLLFFYANDERVPIDIQEEMRKWGYAKDEFKDNNGWPNQIYVREARRMIGDFVMTENEILGKSKVPHPIGMGSYTMDSHNVQRYITKDGFVQNEGDIGVKPNQPYQIDLGAITPKKEECKNLLVVAAVSSSHIAFGSIRMEPVFMILGQSAAIVASIAIEENKSIQEIDYNLIEQEMLKVDQIIEIPKN